jgi:hypothetical protein
LQEVHRRNVFEAKYRNRFSCLTFQRPAAKSCNGSFTGVDSALEQAVVEYAQENLALVKVQALRCSERFVL